MLDYGSEDIDGMDDDAGEEEAQNPPFTDVGRPLLRMTCTWWIHPKRIAAATSYDTAGWRVGHGGRENDGNGGEHVGRGCRTI